MPLFKEEYKKEEKINGVIYDMLPSPNYQHGIVNGNIYRIIISENNFCGNESIFIFLCVYFQ